MKVLKYLFALAIITGHSFAQTITETFGSGTNQFSIEFAQIGNSGNTPDNTGYGAVPYTYNLGKYEISRIMIEKANTQGNLGLSLPNFAQDPRSEPIEPESQLMLNRPAFGLNILQVFKFINWLNTSTGGVEAYKFDVNGSLICWSINDQGFTSLNPLRNSLARFWLPSRDEWYKGAYGSPSGGWYSYAQGSDVPPVPIDQGTTAGTAVFGQTALYAWPADITNSGGLSAYGTMAQGGNVPEWNEFAYYESDGTPQRFEVRGGSWASSISELGSSVFTSLDSYESDAGFRIAMVPEPSALSLLAVGLGGLAMMRRRRS